MTISAYYIAFFNFLNEYFCFSCNPASSNIKYFFTSYMIKIQYTPIFIFAINTSIIQIFIQYRFILISVDATFSNPFPIHKVGALRLELKFLLCRSNTLSVVLCALSAQGGI